MWWVKLLFFHYPYNVCNLCFPVFLQYISALRPPKKRHHSLAGISIDSDTDVDTAAISRVFQRRASFTYPKPLGTRDCFQNRSLQDFSDRIRVNMENQLELSRREEPTLNAQINKPEQETLFLSTESVSSDTTVDEWKQASMEQRCFLRSS